MKKTGKHNFKFYYSLLPYRCRCRRSRDGLTPKGEKEQPVDISRATIAAVVVLRVVRARYAPPSQSLSFAATRPTPVHAAAGKWPKLIHRYYHMYPPRRIINKR